MSMDRLQEKIRKTKNPTLLHFELTAEDLPAHLLEQEGNFIKAYTRFAWEILEKLQGVIPAVRLSFGSFALLGDAGLAALAKISDKAHKLGYYVLMDMPEALSFRQAQIQADLVFHAMFPWYFDGALISAYIGSDAIKPYVARLEQKDCSFFVCVRSGNRSGAELQDLLTGGRHVFEAMADIVNRFKNTKATKSGYDRVAITGPASSASILRKMREKYKNLFILVDDFDSPSANAKNCAEAVDKFGHGAVICVGSSITAAWRLNENDGTDFAADALEATERIKKNLTRYFTVL